MSRPRPQWWPDRRAAQDGRRFWSARRAAVAVEGVISLFFTVSVLAAVFEIVGDLLKSDLLERAAYAVAQDTALQPTKAKDSGQLRTWNERAIIAELGEGVFDFARLKIKINVYDSPSAMLDNTPLSGDDAEAGGVADEMVVACLHYYDTPEALLEGSDCSCGRPLSEESNCGPSPTHLQALGVARNERVGEL